MSIDKWLDSKDQVEEKIKREKIFKKLSKEEVQELKKKKAKDLVQKRKNEKKENLEENDFLQKVIEFKNWLNQRTYLKGDLDKIEMWLTNLNLEIKSEAPQGLIIPKNSKKRQAIDQYQDIPPKFLEENIRIAISKKIHGGKKTSTDHYYLRKLKKLIQEKLIEAKYYKILDEILKI